MIDLTSPNAFKDEKYDLKKYVNNRIITSDQVDKKNKEIDDWIAEQEAQKNRTPVDMNIDGWQNPQELQQQQDFSSMQNSFMSAQTDDYEDLVKTIRQSLQPHRKNNINSNNASFGMNNNMGLNDYTENVNPAFYWAKIASWGRLLNSYEDKELDDKEQKNNNLGGSFSFGANNNQQQNTESKEDKANRLMIEDWKPTLFAGKISLTIIALTAVMALLSIHPLFANPYILFGISLIPFAFITFQLNNKFNDGPLKGNFLFNELAIQRYLHQQQLEKQRKEAMNKQKSNDKKPSMPSFGNNNSDFSFDDDDDFDADFDDEDDETDDENNNTITAPVVNHVSVTKPNEQKTAIIEGDSGFPKAWGTSTNREELYHVEERFLKYCYQMRGKVKLNKPIDILKFFAPIIVSYNKSFASASQVNRNTWVFKNVGYALGKYYNELDTKFAKYGKHDKEYYYVVDGIEETALFYKVKITLPTSVKSDQFKSHLDKFINILKTGPNDDAVDVLLEMAGRSGYVKIMRLNSKGFMPTVSTGDVLRFKNMKTTNGKDLIEELSQPGDLKIFFGLQNAEHALVFDIGGHQNTNMAIDGFTGSGKTVTTTAWFDNILVSHSPDEVGFLILDPKKGSAWQAFRYAPHVLGYFATEDMKKWPAITEMLRQIESARQDYMNNTIRMENYYEARKAFASDEDWKRLMTVPRLIVIYDEMIDTMSTLSNFDAEAKTENKMIKERDAKKFAVYKDSFKTSLGGLSNVTREGGMTLIVLSQRSDDNSMPRTFLSSASIQFGMRTKYPTDLARLFSTDENKLPKNITHLPVGSGYLAANGLPLSQMSTPLFSGDPKLNAEITKTVGLAWTILYSYDHDETKVPSGYFFEKAKQKDVYGLPKFTLFNRDKMYLRIKKELLNGDVHYAKMQSDLRLDLDNKQLINSTEMSEKSEETLATDLAENEQSSKQKVPEFHNSLAKNDNAMEKVYETPQPAKQPITQTMVKPSTINNTQTTTNVPTPASPNVNQSSQEDIDLAQLAAQEAIDKHNAEEEQQNNNMFAPQPTIQKQPQSTVPKPQPAQHSMFTNNGQPMNYKAVLSYFEKNNISRIDCATLEHFYSLNLINAAINTQHLAKQGNFYVIRRNTF